jgi:hypothetical protein
MSVVTNVILAWGSMDDIESKEVLDQINAYLNNQEDQFQERGLVSVEDDSLPSGWYGGTKYLECSLAIGAFNYLHLSEFVEFLKSFNWEKYRTANAVQLMILEENEYAFKIITIREARFQ